MRLMRPCTRRRLRCRDIWLELEYQLLLAHDLEYLSRDAYLALNEQVAEVKCMLYRFMQSLNSTS